jgi:hypothetical protein
MYVILSHDKTSPTQVATKLTGRDIVAAQEAVEGDEDGDEDGEIRGHTARQKQEPIPLQPECHTGVVSEAIADLWMS